MPRDLPVGASCSEPTVYGNFNFLCSDTRLSRTAAFLLSSCYRRSFRLISSHGGPEHDGGEGVNLGMYDGKDDAD